MYKHSLPKPAFGVRLGLFRQVDKKDTFKVANKLRGVMVSLDRYKEVYGSPSKNQHKVVKSKNPLTQQLCEAVFVPERPAGEWDAELVINQSVSSSSVVDNDLDALRNGQLCKPQWPPWSMTQ